ncbi:hypothetical protein Pmani_015669 [Petrolisthes manimaculis]|uniref:Uncharacterized protein n=1 Tax=Petrolisthes manimaculis TaxID=1843537 RepID=A0AAE1U7H0_9EUCA|nr:hypothetical protein Pmani_015669 [Petrolisthes manimaculis]
MDLNGWVSGCRWCSSGRRLVADRGNEYPSYLLMSGINVQLFRVQEGRKGGGDKVKAEEFGRVGGKGRGDRGIGGVGRGGGEKVKAEE